MKDRLVDVAGAGGLGLGTGAPAGSGGRPIVVLRPAPRRHDELFDAAARAELDQVFQIVDLPGIDRVADEELLDVALPEVFAIVGQPALPRERIARAPRLRAVLNVEGNFLPNVDYRACFERGIHVLSAGPAFAQPVAEYALGLALDLARGISREDRAFRAGEEGRVTYGGSRGVLLRGADIGLLGFGSLGRALHPLLAPFRPTIRVYDPWLPASVLRERGLAPASLDETVSRSQFLFVLAAATTENRHLLGAAELALAPLGARLVLVSRAPVVDYEALLERVAGGHLMAAVDVWPEEPLALDHPARALDGLVLSGHRAGGIPAAFREIGEMVRDDLLLLARGLPPVRMQPGARELVERYRNRPVTGQAG